MHVTGTSLLLAAAAILTVATAQLPPAGGPVHLFKRTNRNPSPDLSSREGLHNALNRDPPAIYSALICMQGEVSLESLLSRCSVWALPPSHVRHKVRDGLLTFWKIAQLHQGNTEAARNDLDAYLDGTMGDRGQRERIARIAQSCVNSQLETRLANVDGERARKMKGRPNREDEGGRASSFMQFVPSVPDLFRTATRYMSPGTSHAGHGALVPQNSGLRAIRGGWR